MSNLFFFFIFFLFFTFTSASTSSPIAYSAVLAIVIIELIFAFSVGIACIFFSFNLFRALKDSPNDLISSMPEGYLPPRAPNRNISSDSFYSSSSTTNPIHNSTIPPSLSNPNSGSHPEVGNRFLNQDELLDEETQVATPQPPQSIFQTFYSYIRIW